MNANASLESVKPRFAVEQHVAELFATIPNAQEAEPLVTASEAPQEAAVPTPSEQEAEPLATASEAPQEAPVPLPTALTGERWAELSEENRQRHDWIAGLGQPDPNEVRWNYQRISHFRVSTTDPDATLMQTRGGSHLGYHTHYVVDGGKARIILAALVTPSEVMENQPMLDLVWQTRFRWKVWPRQVTGDTTYGTRDTIAALEQQHIRAYMPLPNTEQRTPFYPKSLFQYDPERDVSVCPNHEILRWYTYASTKRAKWYRADATTCNACPLKSQGTAGETGRTIERSFEEEYLDRVRAYHTTQAYQKARRKRSVWVEPLFAEGKEWHGMRRFRLRRLWRVNIEALMRAAGQNLKRLLKRRGWGRRPWPEGAVGAASHPDWEDGEQQMEDAPGRTWARTVVASMVSLGSIWRLRHVETGSFSHAVVVQVGAPSSADVHSLMFLLRFCGSLNRVFGGLCCKNC